MFKRQAPLVFFSFALFAFSISLGVICRDPQLPERIFPASSSAPYTILDILGTPEEPEPTTTAFVVYVQPTPVSNPKPVPTYDSSKIEVDYNCGDTGDCRWICHYDQGAHYAYHVLVGFRAAAAHFSQHPNDSYDDQYETSYMSGCDTLSDEQAGIAPNDDDEGTWDD